MGVIKNILNGQKDFFLDFFALINVVVLSFAYFIGVGLSFLVTKIFFDKMVEEKKDSYWKDSKLTDQSLDSYLKQF